MSEKVLYIFLDEGGNLDFSPSGTKYFTITGVTKERPFYAYSELAELKYDMIEKELGLEYFHASEDRQLVRDQVFKIINKHFKNSRIDSIIIEKRKTEPSLRYEVRFYPEMLGYLLKYILKNFDLNLYNKVLIFTDTLPIKNKRKAVEKAIKTVLSNKLPSKIKYFILHHSSKSNFDLQIADYCNWAIYRKWESKDCRSYDLIKRFVKSEFDIFALGKKYWY